MVGVEEIAEEDVVMAKREMVDLTTKIGTVGPVVRVERRGPVAPVSSYGKTRGYLQDGQWLPSWLVWLRRRRGLVLAALVLVVRAVAAARLVGATGR